MKHTNQSTNLLAVALLYLGSLGGAFAQGTAFTYQGRLIDDCCPAHAGSFVWADATDADFASTGVNQFLIRATGGVGIGKNNPATALDVNGTVTATAFASSGAPLMFSTTDNQPLEIKVNSLRAARIEYAGDSQEDPDSLPDGAPNVILGAPVNFVAAGAVGATVAGGGTTNFNGINYSNSILSSFGAIGGGMASRIAPGSTWSTIAGGNGNDVGMNANACAIGGGTGNLIGANAAASSIAGGTANQIGMNSSAGVIGGGNQNSLGASSSYSTIGGGYLNDIAADCTYGAIAGGYLNGIQAESRHCIIGGGAGNTIQSHAPSSTISGGFYHTIEAGAFQSTIGGGFVNRIQTNAGNATISGGSFNGIQTNAYASTIGGGQLNIIQSGASLSTIGGGERNTNGPNAASSTIAGGSYNSIEPNSAYSAIGGGYLNRCGGYSSTVPGGGGNTAAGDYSLAAGHQAQALHPGAFVWADSAGADFASAANDEFAIRARGGVRVSDDTPNLSFGATTRQMLNLWGSLYGIGVQGYTMYFRADGSADAANGFAWYLGGSHHEVRRNPGAGGREVMYLNNGGLTVNGTFVSASDRNGKENFKPLDTRLVLEKVAALPLSEWNYKQDPSARHVGPMAQDFHTAFGLGHDDKHIATVDADGVALAAIQGLNQKLEEQLKIKEARLAELENRLEKLERLLDSVAQTRGAR